ncbi:MAG TPA: hypothetical protein VLN44_09795 [Pyrinomonadaceae bacterium]|nr:hypothetical protein [Pyrinomonadaceae bacterium]
MKFNRSIIACLALSLLGGGAFAQDPNVKHYDKDGLSFDYPANWQFSDQSTAQMQYIQMARDGFAEIRIRIPREWLKTPEKEAAAKKLIQDQYVDNFANQVEQAGMNPKRSVATTQISGAEAQGARIRAVMDGQPGGMDSYFNITSDRLVQMSIIGSEKEIAKSAPVWDMIRNSLKVAPPPQPKPSASPTPKGKP